MAAKAERSVANVIALFGTQPEVEEDEIPVGIALVNSFILFSSSGTMHFALENWKHLNKAKFNGWLIATIVLGLGFLGGQAHEWTGVLKDGITWQNTTMGASFFTLTGLHGLHVFIGVCYLTILGIQASRGVYTGSKYFGLTAGMVVDTFPRRRLLVGVNLLRSVFALSLVARPPSLAGIFAATLGIWTIHQFHAPTESAAMGGLVPRERLTAFGTKLGMRAVPAD